MEAICLLANVHQFNVTFSVQCTCTLTLFEIVLFNVISVAFLLVAGSWFEQIEHPILTISYV